MSFFRKIVFFVLFLSCSFLLNAQDEEEEEDYVTGMPRDYDKNPARLAGFIELGGNAGLYTLNFDVIYFYREKFKMSGRVGFAPHMNGIYVEQEYVGENNFILFSNPHHLEFGLGLTIQRRYNERPNRPDDYFWENISYGIFRCGYRFQRQDDGLFLRFAVTPVFTRNDAEGFHPDYFQMWGGLSIGVSF